MQDGSNEINNSSRARFYRNISDLLKFDYNKEISYCNDKIKSIFSSTRS